MPDYRKGMIYMLKSKDETIKKVYIGSTCNFSRRKTLHKSNCCNPNAHNYNTSVYKFIRDNDGWYEWEMVKIKDYPCNLKCELEKEEDKEVLKYGYDNCLNDRRPNRSIKKYREDNKEKIKEKNKQWYEQNKEKIKEQKKIYYEQNKEANKEKIKEYNKKYREDNKEKIKEYYKANREQILEKEIVKMTCECGSVIRKSAKLRHEKTKKHIKFMENK